MSDLKECSLCGEELPLTSYQKNGKILKSGQPGYRSECKGCANKPKKTARAAKKTQVPIELTILDDIHIAYGNLGAALENDDANEIAFISERLANLAKKRVIEKLANVNNSFTIAVSQIHGFPLIEELKISFLKSQVSMIIANRLNIMPNADKIKTLLHNDKYIIIMEGENLTPDQINIIIHML